MCQICLDDRDAPATTLECGHEFHTTCIIQWFRGPSNACPMCRAAPATVLAFPDVMQRATLLRRKARAKTAPAALKRSAAALLRAETLLQNVRNEYKAFATQEIRASLAKVRALRRRTWALQRRVVQRKRALGLGVYPGLALPLLSGPYSPGLLFR